MLFQNGTTSSSSLNQTVVGNNLNIGITGGNNLSVTKGTLVPWPSEPTASWVYYDCAVGVMLDSGIVVHNRLPQINRLPDTLASRFLDDKTMAAETQNGINLKCNDQYTDILQRMGHARYWFRLWGKAMRVGYKVPIPGIKSIGGVPAIPYDKNPQWAYCKPTPGGNYGGMILWMAEWSLWYTTLVPPTSNTIPTNNPAALIPQDTAPQDGVQAPFN